nr:phosphodiester glycosidase family protein [Pectinatus sottacetonis]
MTDIRSSISPEKERIVFEFDDKPVYNVSTEQDGKCIVFDISGVNAQAVKDKIPAPNDVIKSFNISNTQAGCKVSIELKQKQPYTVNVLNSPDRIFIDIQRYYKDSSVNHVMDGFDYTTFRRYDENGVLTAYIANIDPAKFSFVPVLGGGRTLGKNTVLNMARYYNAVAAVNASYFGGEKEVYGLTKIDGTIATNTYLKRTAFGIDAAGKPIIGQVSYSGSVHTKNGDFFINGVNCAREANTIVEYNSFYGDSTQTNEYGIEYVVENNKIVKINTNDTLLKDGQIVISANGTMKDALNGLKVGDEMTINEDLGSDEWNKASEIIGVGPQLVKNGQIDITAAEEQIGPDVTGGQSPRTAVGITNDGHVLLLVADGRQSISDGLTLKQLARLLIEFGAKNAVNFDGGGSSELVIKNEVINSPSDGIQRPVGVSLAVIKK